MRVIFLDTVHSYLQETLEKNGFQCDIETNKTKKELEDVMASYEGIVIRSRISLDKAFLEKARNLKFIARSGAGLENIDLKYCKQNGIECFNAPEGNRDAVGEHVLGMLLSLFNKLCKGNMEIKNGKWNREGNRGLELQGKTVAIIGYGNMGSAFAQRLKGFDCEVLAYDKYKENYSTECVKEASLQEVWQTADIVSLHVPLTEETDYMVDGQFIGQFKKPFFIINTSRGRVIQTSALVSALKKEKVLGACLDVLEYESKAFDLSSVNNTDLNFLQQSEKVLLSPHVAGWTVESYRKLSEVLAKKIISNYQ